MQGTPGALIFNDNDGLMHILDISKIVDIREYVNAGMEKKMQIVLEGGERIYCSNGDPLQSYINAVGSAGIAESYVVTL